MYNNSALIIDKTLEMILVIDSDGKIEAFNQKAKDMLEYSEELTNYSVYDILPQIFPENSNIRNVAKKYKNKNASVFVYRENRTCFPVEFKMSCLDENVGRYVCFMIERIERDALKKELVKVKEQAIEATKVQNEFTANVTHELRTPVNGILGHVQNLLNENQNAEITETLEIIQHCCDNMNKIINNILDFSKLSAGKFTIEELEFDVYQMIKHISDTNIARIHEKGLAFSVHIADNVPQYLIGDELRITQVLNNLLSNATKFTLTGRISLEVTKTLSNEDEVELFFMVIDTGIGIEKKDMDKLFKDFSQVDASVSRKFGGTGLGLSVSKQLVELMKGNINVQSQKGKGSNFSFSVRLKRADRDNEADEKTEEFSIPVYDDTGIWEQYEIDIPKEIASNMEKMVLCIELESWEKAEQFAIKIKSLGMDFGDDFRRACMRIEIQLRKENHDGAIKAYDKLKQLYEEITGEGL